MNKKNIWNIPTKKYCMVVKIEKVLTNPTIWMTFRNNIE